MWGSYRADAVGEFQSRVAAAVADTPYRMRPTGQGFELTVDVPGPERRLHTYRVVLRQQERAFTMTDVVRTAGYGAGPDGAGLGKAVSVGRSVYVVKGANMDGTGRYRFSSADGHRLIRGVAEELGWRELRPTSVKVAIGFGVFGAVVCLGTLIALAVVFWS
ncbi:hypothetical protein GCM10010260_02590 [Streptomyces filipinensis]|uniref:Uncharacterized protein n=1 Tax=Streptomyces filipinensis TaxID=66887 RepID=A0A918I534_9ACTN|nr:hypothetical protein [Streptomyces filipinensis]GGU74242.1 hypothetical protein GCM10010260_02590 [Streptomyces filipinensis]